MYTPQAPNQINLPSQDQAPEKQDKYEFFKNLEIRKLLTIALVLLVCFLGYLGIDIFSEIASEITWDNKSVFKLRNYTIETKKGLKLIFSVGLATGLVYFFYTLVNGKKR